MGRVKNGKSKKLRLLAGDSGARRATLSQASVYAREIVKMVLRLNAAALIMAHNYPSGSPKPSMADLNLIKHLKQALMLIDVRILYHVIVIAKGTTSLAELGANVRRKGQVGGYRHPVSALQSP